MIDGHYILDIERKPILVSLHAWAQWHGDSWDKGRVGDDNTSKHRISTVFFGADMNFSGKGPPLLFETMVFVLGTHEDIECWRYATWDDAYAGHVSALRRYQKIDEEVGHEKEL